MTAKLLLPDPTLIIVSGPPASGKTTIASRIALEFGLPSISKDQIKETLFDTLGIGDRDWSMKLGLASVVLMFKVIETQLEAGKSLVAEANFYTEFDTPRFRDLKASYEFNLVQVHCVAHTEVLLSRYRERWNTGARHPGHIDHNRTDDLERGLAEAVWQPMTIDGRTVSVDTSDFDCLSYDDLFRLIQSDR